MCLLAHELKLEMVCSQTFVAFILYRGTPMGESSHCTPKSTKIPKVEEVARLDPFEAKGLRQLQEDLTPLSLGLK